MPESHLREPLGHAGEKGSKGIFRSVRSGGRRRRRRVPQTGERECAGLSDRFAVSSPWGARQRHPGSQGGWGAAFGAAVVSEVEALTGSGRPAAEELKALEQARRHEALGIAAEAMRASKRRIPIIRARRRRAPADGRPVTQAAARRPSPCSAGPLTVQRAYIPLRRPPRRGSCPRDDTLGLRGSSVQAAIMCLVGLNGGRPQLRQAERAVGCRVQGRYRDPAG